MSAEPPIKSLVLRGSIGGMLMGLANLVPGISGGTMLLASGIYPRFIQSVADVSTLKLHKRSLVTLATVAGSAALAILLLAGPVKGLVVDHRWVMYSLFIGLTLGGVPVIWNMVKPADNRVWAGAAVGFVAMAAIAYAQTAGLMGEGSRDGFLLLFFAGIAGASAMILPGISGGYLLLVLGVYVPILGGIDTLKQALKAMDVQAAIDPLLGVVLPVGLGVGVGTLVVSNALKWLLTRYEKTTLGTLLGFLVGAILGLWPFQHGVAPAVGSTFKGQVVTPELLAEIEPEKYPTELFTPEPTQVVAALVLVAAGFFATALIARLGSERRATSVSTSS